MTDRIRAAIIELQAAIDDYCDTDEKFDAWQDYATEWDLPLTLEDWIDAH